MSAPVDVLAVMDAARARLNRAADTAPHGERQGRYDAANALTEARAAAAELARVSRAVLDDMNSVAPKYRAQQSVDELTAALAPFGGAR